MESQEFNQDTTKLLKALDIAKVLNMSRSKAYQMMKVGSIPTVRIDRLVRVREQDLHDFIENHWFGREAKDI
jgi:excisionase family DNA binding protein